MAIAKYPSVVLDCPDPALLARFYGALLDWEVTESPGWAEARADYGQCLCFQQVDDYAPPAWPGQERPQQLHLDASSRTSTRPSRRSSRSALPRRTTSPARPPGVPGPRRRTRSASA